LLAEAIYTNSAHHFLIEPDKITHEIPLKTGLVVWRVKRVVLAFEATDLSLNPPFYKLILLPFSIAYQLREAIIINKNEEDI